MATPFTATRAKATGKSRVAHDVQKLHEIKNDGHRLLVAVGGTVRTFTRSGTGLSEKLTDIGVAELRLDVRLALLDGEDLTGLPFAERKAKLLGVLPEDGYRIRYSEHSDGSRADQTPPDL